MVGSGIWALPDQGGPEADEESSSRPLSLCRLSAISGLAHQRRFSLHTVVTILDTHYVIKLSGTGLEDDRILEGRHAVPSARSEMYRLTWEQLERFQRGVGITYLEEKSA